MADRLLSAEFVPSAAAEMVATAERTGALGPVTDLISQHYEEEGEVRLRELVAVLEPVIIIVMGVVVATVVLSVMLPMFDMATLAQRAS
jgi:type II secretory pathway component PulF